MVVMGIDPGTASTGYGVVRRRDGRFAALDGGVIETAARSAPASASIFASRALVPATVRDTSAISLSST